MAETEPRAAIMRRSEQGYGRRTSVAIRLRVAATRRAAMHSRSSV